MTPAALPHPDDAGAMAAGVSSRTQEETQTTTSMTSTASSAADANTRLREMFARHFDFIWRSLRRFGLSDDRADDAAQQVFMIASRKLDVIQPNSERSFLFGSAMRVASDIRRSAYNRREIAHADAGMDLEDHGARPDDLLDQRRARLVLDEVLDAMDLDLRSVFVLFEIEEMTTTEIATLLEIPHGTVASRLRRAREEFKERVARRTKEGGRAIGQQHQEQHRAPHKEGGTP